MDNKRVEIAVDLVIAGVVVLYILSLNPTSYIYLRNYARQLRWWLWSNTTPAWVKEALQVRGYIA